jgi:hypothetical protein
MRTRGKILTWVLAAVTIVSALGLRSTAVSGHSEISSRLLDGERRWQRPDPPCFDNTNRYVNCGNGTVTDTATGLRRWQRLVVFERGIERVLVEHDLCSVGRPPSRRDEGRDHAPFERLPADVFQQGLLSPASVAGARSLMYPMGGNWYIINSGRAGLISSARTMAE